jgi:phospholipid/cholesterol/gamma-HCH transport system permease protein
VSTAARHHKGLNARAPVEAIGSAIIKLISDWGGMAIMGAQLALGLFRPPWRIRLALQQMDFIGVGSAFLVMLTGFFTGMVFAQQVGSAFALFSAQSLVGPTVVIALTRELAPVFTALMITMRAGSAICTELGTMRVTEQIDALVTLAVDPVKYLVFPRVLAGVFMAPVLCMLFNAAGIFGTWVVAVLMQGISEGTLLAKTTYYVTLDDVTQGLIKSAVFGLIITLIACFKGFNAGGGARGVGQATTEAMVMTAVLIFLTDYLMGLVLIPG